MATKSVEPNPQFPATPNPSSDLPDTAKATVGSSDTQAGVLTPQAKQPASTQTDINSILEPYLKEMQNLGPEYQAEMDYLKPYLQGTGAEAPETFQQIEAGSKADETPTGSAKVNEADQSLGQAIEGQAKPGLGELATAGEEYAGTVPYSQILQTVLGAGKNEILYGTIPNISNISTKGWPESLQNAYQFLTQAATGTNAQTGLPSPTSAATAQAAQQQAASTAGGLYNTNPSQVGAGNVG
jgi:hypothetical protein